MPRYHVGDDEYEKATTKKDDESWPEAGTDYKEISVKAGEPLINPPAKVIESYLSMGRDVITTKAPEAPEAPKKAKAVKA